MNRSSARGWGQFGGMAGFALAGLGFVLMLVGYTLAAGQPTGDLRLQFPYLLSCGLPGLGLIILGSSLVRTSAARTDRDMIIAAVLAASAEPAGALVPRQVSKPLVPSTHEGGPLVVAGSSSYHEESCRLVEGREAGEWITPEQARARALTPCRVCKPERALVQ